MRLYDAAHPRGISVGPRPAVWHTLGMVPGEVFVRKIGGMVPTTSSGLVTDTLAVVNAAPAHPWGQYRKRRGRNES